VLETEFESDEGVVRVIDFMPRRGEGPPRVMRIVEGVRGRVPIRMELLVRPEYGTITPWVERSRTPRPPPPARCVPAQRAGGAPHRRQLRDDRKVVELGRGLSDNLVKYVRFQMSVLAGMIITFLGASILTFALANLFFSFTARDELRSVCSLDTVNDRTFLITSLISVAASVFVTELQFFQRGFDTVELTGNQWLICIGAVLTIVVASEIRKFLLRGREPAATTEQTPTETVPA
jgi:hypothetical protein